MGTDIYSRGEALKARQRAQMGIDTSDSESFDDFEPTPRRRRKQGGGRGRGRRRRQRQQDFDDSEEEESYGPQRRSKGGRGRRRQQPYGRGRGGRRRGQRQLTLEQLEAKEARLKEELKKTRQQLLKKKAQSLKSQLGRIEKQLGNAEKKKEPVTEEEKRAALDRELEDYKFGPAPHGKNALAALANANRSNATGRNPDAFSKKALPKDEKEAAAMLDNDLDSYFAQTGGAAPASTYEEPKKTTGPAPRLGTNDSFKGKAGIQAEILKDLGDQTFKLN